MSTRRNIDINHGELRVRLDELRRLEDNHAIHDALTRLLPFLKRHFADEESSDSFFDLVRRTVPARRDDLVELERQHEQFLATVQRLITRADGGAATNLTGDIGQLIRSLEAHERIEHELLRLTLGGRGDAR